MARQARIDTPGAIHHIMVRGIERKKIFRDDKALGAITDMTAGR